MYQQLVRVATNLHYWIVACFIENKDGGQKVGFPLCSYSIVVDIPEIIILMVYGVVGFK